MEPVRDTPCKRGSVQEGEIDVFVREVQVNEVVHVIIGREFERICVAHGVGSLVGEGMNTPQSSRH